MNESVRGRACPFLPAAGNTPEFAAWKQQRKLDEGILSVPPNN
jgi:hypothetical protein